MYLFTAQWAYTLKHNISLIYLVPDSPLRAVYRYILPLLFLAYSINIRLKSVP
jgi:hypothetical protein